MRLDLDLVCDGSGSTALGEHRSSLSLMGMLQPNIFNWRMILQWLGMLIHLEKFLAIKPQESLTHHFYMDTLHGIISLG